MMEATGSPFGSAKSIAKSPDEWAQMPAAGPPTFPAALGEFSISGNVEEAAGTSGTANLF